MVVMQQNRGPYNKRIVVPPYYDSIDLDRNFRGGSEYNRRTNGQKQSVREP